MLTDSDDCEYNYYNAEAEDSTKRELLKQWALNTEGQVERKCYYQSVGYYIHSCAISERNKGPRHVDLALALP